MSKGNIIVDCDNCGESFNITANELRIFTEAGRPCRPLLILKYNNANKKNEAVVYSKANEFKNWFDLLNEFIAFE